MNVFAKRTTRKQSGAALIAFLLVFVTAASFVLIRGLNETATQQYRDAQTTKALAEAKAALIGYAAGANIIPDGNCGLVSDCPRPGDLPCPDRDNNGDAENQVPGCGTASGGCPSGMPQCRLGRLPWKTLQLPDLRDGSGERLWYAVSDNFKLIPRRPCGSSGSPECLNSGSRGTITVVNANGAIKHNGTDMSGAIAVVFAPGPVLTRQGAGASQDRACTNCNASDECGSPPTAVPRCQPEQYLDWRSSPLPIEDNQNFEDNSATNGFIEGPVFDAQGNLIINDKLAVITYEDLMPLLERRVVGEVLKCLKAYAAELATPPNRNRYPWAAALSASGPTYDDSTNTRFGRVPDGLPDPVFPVLWTNPVGLDEQFTTTQFDSGNAMAKSWPFGKCLIISEKSKNTWWLNWKESVFYGVAEGFAPNSSPAPTACALSPACLMVAPATAADAKFVVIAAGRSLAGVPGGQPRISNAQKGQIANYLEADNATVPPSDETFTSGPVTPAFNDVVCKQGVC